MDCWIQYSHHDNSCSNFAIVQLQVLSSCMIFWWKLNQQYPLCIFPCWNQEHSSLCISVCKTQLLTHYQSTTVSENSEFTIHNSLKEKCLIHGIMGRRFPDGGLLRYRKWVPQQLGDVIVVTNSPPIGHMRSKLTNHQVGIVLDVQAWSEKLFYTSRCGRKNRKLSGNLLPIIPW